MKRKERKVVRKFLSRSVDETLRFAKEFGRSLSGGSVVALEGELGSGKTVFVKGIALGLGLANPDQVKSPTFVLMHIYPTKVPLYHFDLYRLEHEEELDALGFDDFASDSRTITVVEWADRVRERIPSGAIWIKLHGSGFRHRQITIQ